jgi:hypothetical protein
MSFATAERAIWKEAQEVACNKKLRLKDLMEWSTSEEIVKEGMLDNEVMFQVPSGVWVCIPQEMDKRTPA